MEFSGQYLTYKDYQELGGTLSEMPFNLLEYEARQSIDKYTFGRLKDLEEQSEETKLCTYKLIELINSYNKYEAQNKGVASESIDGYSVSYSTPDSSFTMAKNNEIENVVRTYLVDCKLEDGTPYMYCGAK